MEMQIERNISQSRESDLLFIIKCLIALMVVVTATLISVGMGIIDQNTIDVVELKASYELKIEKLNTEYAISSRTIDEYKYRYTKQTEELEQSKAKVVKLQSTLDYKNEIAKKMQNSKSSAVLQYMKLYSLYDMTVAEMDTWLAERAPKNSPFLGRGKDFIEAGEQTGLNPTYLAAHAGEETGWGTSSIARNKNNYYGIGAFNNKTSNAYSFSRGSNDIITDKVSIGIIQGAKWIKQNYIDKGQDSLYLMIYGNSKHVYCVKDDNTPDGGWAQRIADIMKPKA